MTKNVYH